MCAFESFWKSFNNFRTWPQIHYEFHKFQEFRDIKLNKSLKRKIRQVLQHSTLKIVAAVEKETSLQDDKSKEKEEELIITNSVELSIWRYLVSEIHLEMLQLVSNYMKDSLVMHSTFNSIKSDYIFGILHAHYCFIIAENHFTKLVWALSIEKKILTISSVHTF